MNSGTSGGSGGGPVRKGRPRVQSADDAAALSVAETSTVDAIPFRISASPIVSPSSRLLAAREALAADADLGDAREAPKRGAGVRRVPSRGDVRGAGVCEHISFCTCMCECARVFDYGVSWHHIMIVWRNVCQTFLFCLRS